MALIILTSEQQVRGLQALIIARAGRQALGSVSIVQHGAGQTYHLEKWPAEALGELPTIQQIITAIPQFRPQPDDSPIALAERIADLENRLNRAGL